jgi:hypothetical protein
VQRNIQHLNAFGHIFAGYDEPKEIGVPTIWTSIHKGIQHFSFIAICYLAN